MDSSFIDNQNRFDVRCEWGADAIEYLYESTDVFIIVDVLSFSTCVEVATSKGATIIPYKYKDESAKSFAAEKNAELAVHRTEPGQFSLSPVSMFTAEKGMRIVLPSPNGATLSIMCAGKITLCGSFRNAKSVAELSQRLGKTVTVISAGEKWPNGNIRFALEDALGAGAILSYMNGSFSPEATALRNLWVDTQEHLFNVLQECTSGNELITRSSEQDIDIASEVNITSNVPILTDDAEYVSYTSQIR